MKKLFALAVAGAFALCAAVPEAAEVTRSDEVRVAPEAQKETNKAKKKAKKKTHKAKKKTKRGAKKAKKSAKSAAHTAERKTEAAADRTRDNVNR